jgi:hypothetical protein
MINAFLFIFAALMVACFIEHLVGGKDETLS